MGENPLFDQLFLDNTVKQWAIAAGVTFAVFVGLRLAAAIVIRRLEAFTNRTRTDFDDLIIELLRKTKGLFIVLVAVWMGSFWLQVNPPLDEWLQRGLGVGLLIQGALWATGVVNYFMGRHRKRQEEEA